MMLSISDLKAGTWINFQGQPYQVVSSFHVKLGRGGGMQKVKLKNPFTGTTLERTFKGQDRVEEARLDYKMATFLYKDSQNLFFMDPQNYEQFSLELANLQGREKFLKEGEGAKIVWLADKPLDLQLPTKIKLKVTYTEPGFRGDTVSAPQKEAKLETGATIKVPLFIKTGDTVIINTETGKYVERA